MAHIHAHDPKAEKSILTAFLLNFGFALFEFFGGLFTGSAAILSDALHDFGDAASIAVSLWCEKKSRKEPNERYTFGYVRYSVLGSVCSTLILLIGSTLLAVHSILRLQTPTELHHNGMIVLSLIGLLVNLLAARMTHGGHSLNQKAVTLHLLEDVFGWASVLLTSIVIRLTDWNVLDPLLSLFLCAFFIFQAAKILKEAMGIFLEKAPHGLNVQNVTEALCQLEGVYDVHHVHLWTLSGQEACVTLHAVCATPSQDIKHRIKETLLSLNIHHSTVELEETDEHCLQRACTVSPPQDHVHK